MTPEEVAGLLAYASAVDPRIRRKDPAELLLQVEAWHTQLAQVALGPAKQAVDAHYSRPGVDAILPGDVRHGAGDSAQARHPSARPMREVIAELDAVPAVDTGPYRRELRAMLARQSARWALPSADGAGESP